MVLGQSPPDKNEPNYCPLGPRSLGLLPTRTTLHQESWGGISSSVLSVFFTDNCYKLLKSLHLIGWEQLCQWKTLTKRLMKCPPGPLPTSNTIPQDKYLHGGEKCWLGVVRIRTVKHTRVGWYIHRLTKKELCHSNETWHALNSAFPDTNSIVFFQIR